MSLARQIARGRLMADAEKKNLPAHKPSPKVTVASQPGVEIHTDRHKVAKKALETAEMVSPDPECSDPECGYRKIVEAQKAKHRDRVKKWRGK